MGGTNKYCIIYFTSALICCLYLFNCLNSGRLEKSTDWFQAKSLPETMDFLVKYIEISFSFSLKTSVFGKFEISRLAYRK